MLIVFNYKRVTYPLSHHNITLNKIDGVNIEPKFGNSKWLQRQELQLSIKVSCIF